MTTGEGGMVTTNDDNLAAKIRLMRSHGMTTLTLDRHRGHAHSYDVVELGYNYRLDELRSALGRVQLDKLSKTNRKRQEIQKWYRKRLASTLEVSIPYSNCIGKPVYHIFPILLNKNISRNRFINGMKERGIQTSIHYPPIHLFKFYRRTLGLQKGHLPLTEEVGRREVTLPLYASMTKTDVEHVCRSVTELLEQERSL